MKRVMRKTSLIFIILMTVLLAAAPVLEAAAGPIVIKDSEKGIGTEESPDDADQERDRSLQDGSVIYGMTPVYPEDFREGSYSVSAVSNSQFFKITQADITNKDGRIEAVIRISSTSYAYVYPGTAAEAESADQSEWIAADESSGYGEFTIEAEALNKEMPCAAFSKKKKTWYDRDIVLLAEDIPESDMFIDLAEGGETILDTQDAAMKVIYIALAIIIAGGILNFFIKRKYYE